MAGQAGTTVRLRPGRTEAIRRRYWLIPGSGPGRAGWLPDLVRADDRFHHDPGSILQLFPVARALRPAGAGGRDVDEPGERGSLPRRRQVQLLVEEVIVDEADGDHRELRRKARLAQLSHDAGGGEPGGEEGRPSLDHRAGPRGPGDHGGLVVHGPRFLHV